MIKQEAARVCPCKLDLAQTKHSSAPYEKIQYFTQPAGLPTMSLEGNPPLWLDDDTTNGPS